MIPHYDGEKVPGGLFFQRNENGTHTVLSGADYLYDYPSTEHPVLNLGEIDIPPCLTDL